MAQSVTPPTLAQVMISQFVSSSPESVSGLTAQSLEPASDSVSLSVCPSAACSVSYIVSKVNKHLKNFFKNRKNHWGAWVAQSVKCPTLNFCLGHDLTVCEFKPHRGFLLSEQNPLPLSLLLPSPPK